MALDAKDGTTRYYYDNWRIVETRNGSNVMVSQNIWGTQYIGELVMMRAAGKE